MDLKSPLDYFLLLFENDLFEHIFDQSNIYAFQKDGKVVGLSVAEIKTYVGILLKMGIIHPLYYRYYWSNSYSFPSIANAMSRNKFDTIKNIYILITMQMN